MNEAQRLGKNIRALRNAHEETQEKLGYAIGVEKNAISYYENGKREPSNDVIASIARYYMISVEELLYSDLSGMDKIDVNPNILWENIDVFFPMIYTEAALKNEHFKNAFDIHNEVFNQLKNLSLDSVDRLSDCVDEYFEAQNDLNSEVEAAGNIMGIFYFFSLVVQTPKFLKNRSSVLLKISENNREIKKALEEPYPDFGDFEKFLNNEETLEFVDNLLLLVKRSIEW